MSRCQKAGRPGCRGRLCRAAHASLRRLPTVRYPAGDDGRPDTAAQPTNGWVCGLLSYRHAGNAALDIPGHSGGQRAMWFIAAAGSLEPAVMIGDCITANKKTYIVSSVTQADQLTAELIPAEEVA